MKKTLHHIRQNYLAYIIIICGFLGLYAAFWLLLGRIEYYKNPNYVPPCSLNVWLDCGVVMKSKWASLFGFPNTIIGLATYPLAALTGFVMITHKNVSKTFMNFCLFLSGIGLIMNIFLLYISAYIIAALCPWCILSGVATSNIFFAILTYNITKGYISLPFGLNNIKILTSKVFGLLFMVCYYMAIFALVWLSFTLRLYDINTQQFFDPIFWLK